MLILNDLHLGVRRSAGTTPASAEALRMEMHRGFAELLALATGHVCILGDLFDEFTVESFDLITTFHTLADWLNTGTGNLILVRGNHDWHPSGTKVSSFDLLADLLGRMYGARVSAIRDGATSVGENIIVVPHMPNQDLFDMELDAVMDRDGQYLLTHCNIMPPACHGKRDHSLTIGEERAKQLTERFTILNAHEHQHYFHHLGRGIHCLGNQIPSSVADCMAKGHAQGDGIKYAYEITDQGVVRHPVWSALESFAVVDWRDLDTSDPDRDFIRVEGDATAAEAARVVDAIAKFRSKSRAFVVSNAVRTEGQAGVEEAAAATFDSLQAFDVVGALLAELEPAERKVIEEILA